ncbi:MAG: LCP family protein [Clostridia bacterium]|nr:LCP family protein [Clostridia bacterium]
MRTDSLYRRKRKGKTRAGSRSETALDRAYTAALFTFLALAVLTALLLIIRNRSYVPPADTGVPFDAGSEMSPDELKRRTGEKSGDPESYNFLVLGIDRTALLADTVMIVSVRTDGGINVVQLPRDIYVDRAAAGLEGAGGVKLNSLYASVGTERLAAFLSRSLCVKIDYTLTVDTDLFAEAVDAIGGVEIDVPSDMDYDDPEQDLSIHLKAGRQLLNGRQAEGFVRFRSGYATGDLGRLDAQKLFMIELLRTLRDRVGLKEASALADSFVPRLDTDMSVRDAVWFLELTVGKGLSDRESGLSGAGGLRLITIPGRALYSEEMKTSYYVIGRQAALDTVNRYLNIYGGDIPDSVFDRNRAFLRAGDEDFERIYTYAIITPEEYSG